MMENASLFSVVDFVVFFGTLGLSLFVGIYFGWKNRHKNSVENYFLANRKLKVLPTALSLVITFQSSLLIIGVPPEVYSYGFKYVYYVIGPCVSYIFAGLIIVPVFHPLRLTSVYKYFKYRYNDNTVRYVAMSMGIIYYVMYSAGVIFGTCVALDYLMGIPYWGSICIYSLVTAIYTSVGGMKAVIWTDVLQIIIMAMGVSAIIIKSCLAVGGFTNVLDSASSRLDMNDFRIDPTIRYQFWNLSVGSFMSFLVTCFQQPGVQRINSTPTVIAARSLYVISGIMYAVLAFCVCFEGVAIFAYYNSMGCDPLASERIDSTNQLIPLAVADLFSSIPGFAGLFIAALSSAALSTLSSSLSSLGAVTYDDIIRERYPNMSEERATSVSKVVVFLYGMLAMGFSCLIAALPGSILNITYAFMGCTDGPTVALFLVSIFYRKATTKGLVSGAIVGMACMLWLNVGALVDNVKITPTLAPASTYCCSNATVTHSSNVSYECLHDNIITLQSNFSTESNTIEGQLSPLQYFYSISFMIYALVGCIISTIVSILVSFITSPPSEVDERCIFSFKKHIIQNLYGESSQSEDVELDYDGGHDSDERVEKTQLM